MDSWLCSAMESQRSLPWLQIRVARIVPTAARFTEDIGSMYDIDQLECLRNIRLGVIHCARYDEVPDPNLQRLDLEPGLAGYLVSLEAGSPHYGHDLKDLCMATGCILYFHNRRIQSLPVLRFRDALLRYLQDACTVTLSPHIASCYGVIASVLLQSSEAQQAVLPWQNCIVAAMAACIYLQLSHPTCSPPAMLMYSSSVSISFSSCLLEAQKADEVCQLMQPLLRVLRHLCTPAISVGPGVTEEARAKLQRLVVPLVLQLSRRLHQMRGETPAHRTVFYTSPQHQKASMWATLTWEGRVHRADRDQVSSQGCDHASDATIAAADAAQLLAMAYHQQSRASVPNLPQCISMVLQLLGAGTTSAILLAERIPVPGHLLHLQHACDMSSKRAALFKTRLHQADGEKVEEAILPVTAYLRNLLYEHLLPAMQAPGYWPDAAAFMLTLMQSCLPQQHSPVEPSLLKGENAEAARWDALLQRLLPVLAALMTSHTTARKTAVELALAVLSCCPDACNVKRHMCLELAGVLMISWDDVSAGQQLQLLMKGIASSCECASTVLDVCWMCTAVSCRVDPTHTAHATAIALVWVVVHGKPETMPIVLGMVEKLVFSLDSRCTIRACLLEIRGALEQCHDFRKKPFCVRWFHSQLQAASKL